MPGIEGWALKSLELACAIAMPWAKAVIVVEVLCRCEGKRGRGDVQPALMAAWALVLRYIYRDNTQGQQAGIILHAVCGIP